MKEKDYSNGKIYMVFSPSTNQHYIGSTIQTLEKRFYKHKYYLTCSSKTVIDVGDAEIKLIHNFPCKNEDELETEEGEVMKLFPDRINAYTPKRTREEKNIGRRVANQTEQQKETKKKRDKERKFTPEERARSNERQRNKYIEQRDIIKELNKNITQERRDEINTRRRNLTDEQRDKLNESQRNISQEKRDKINKRRRELAAKKKEEAKKDLVV